MIRISLSDLGRRWIKRLIVLDCTYTTVVGASPCALLNIRRANGTAGFKLLSSKRSHPSDHRLCMFAIINIVLLCEEPRREKGSSVLELLAIQIEWSSCRRVFDNLRIIWDSDFCFIKFVCCIESNCLILCPDSRPGAFSHESVRFHRPKFVHRIIVYTRR